MIKLIVWNSRGAAKKGFAAVLKDIKFRYKVDLVVILEPRISGPQASKIIKGWGFRNWVRMEANGFSGGLWIMWERDDLKVEVLEANEQFIHCNLWVGVERVLFTAIYASPNDQKRRELWETLQGLAADIVEPWFLTGDFNEIRSPFEQKGGGRVNVSRCDRFNEWIQRCSLIDVESKGPFFTWKGPKWEDLDRVYKKLDRCLCNVSWLEKYENAEARILPRIHSDHHPVLVNLLGETQSAGPRNFRFQIMWQMHEKFNEVLQQSWIGNDDVHKKLVTLKQDLVVWNKETTCFNQGVQGNASRVADKLNTEGKHLLLAVLPPSNQMGRDKSYVYREGNGCADLLASLSFKQEEVHVAFDSPPLAVHRLLQQDLLGYLYPRRIIVK
ncbi:hypothetical protein K1719_032756 [Acacia pycnantha]|nr:hypothetical protein K1719_032756 [Acacia pycnantha]